MAYKIKQSIKNKSLNYKEPYDRNFRGAEALRAWQTGLATCIGLSV